MDEYSDIFEFLCFGTYPRIIPRRKSVDHFKVCCRLFINHLGRDKLHKKLLKDFIGKQYGLM